MCWRSYVCLVKKGGLFDEGGTPSPLNLLYWLLITFFLSFFTSRQITSSSFLLTLNSNCVNLFRPGINTSLLWPDHKWTALVWMHPKFIGNAMGPLSGGFLPSCHWNTRCHILRHCCGEKFVSHWGPPNGLGPQAVACLAYSQAVRLETVHEQYEI